MKQFFTETFSKVCELSKRFWPFLLIVAGVVYRIMSKKICRLEKEKLSLETEVKYDENVKKAEKANSGKSDVDVVRDAINEGSRSKG